MRTRREFLGATAAVAAGLTTATAASSLELVHPDPLLPSTRIRVGGYDAVGPVDRRMLDEFNQVRDQIRLVVINSDGGDVFSGIQMANTIAKKRYVTQGAGTVGGIALLMLASGEHRYASPDATFHLVPTRCPEADAYLSHLCDRFDKSMAASLASRSKNRLTSEEALELMSLKCVFDAAEAKKLGLIDDFFSWKT